jgi:hypothetical protein
MNEGVTDVYFSARNGVMRRVSKEEWEREWLRWWKQSHLRDE